jgi:HK97 family phage portal protein
MGNHASDGGQHVTTTSDAAVSWFNNLFQRKASVAAPLIVRSVLNRAVWTERDFAKLAKEGYQQNVIAFSCISKTAAAVASLPVAMQRMRGDKWDEVEAHKLLMLLDGPNPGQDGEALIRALVTHYMIAGNAYMERRTIGSEPRELFALRPDRMRVVPGADAMPVQFEYNASGSVVTLEAEDVLHLKEPNPLSDWYGMSRFDPASWSVDAHSGAGALTKALVENSARPSGALVHEPSEAGGTLGADQIAALKAELLEVYTGAANAGRPMLLDGGLKWVPMGMNMRDLQANESKAAAAREIALAFDVPPLLLGLPGDNTFANYNEANVAFYRDSVIPLGRRIYGAIGRWLLPAFGESAARLLVDEDDVSALASERASLWERAQNANFISIDEKRTMVGFDALPGGVGDVVLIPAGLIPLGEIGADTNEADDAEDPPEDDADSEDDGAA